MANQGHLMSKRKYKFRGKEYNRKELYDLFKISESLAYRIMKQNNITLTEVIFYTAHRTINLEGYLLKEKIDISTQTDEIVILNMLKTEPEICSKFGCKERLTPTEKLFGNKCIMHQGEQVKLTGKL